MLLVLFLSCSVVLLLAFALSKETGKNTKYARKNPPLDVQTVSHNRQTIRVNKVIEIN